MRRNYEELTGTQFTHSQNCLPSTYRNTMHPHVSCSLFSKILRELHWAVTTFIALAELKNFIDKMQCRPYGEVLLNMFNLNG